ncbi:hypothetical protein ACOBQB_01035 [Streptomyces sp. G5(2025)]|uniref:hypothetical protein n=1 Tax=Streptomyces sp. G5(2025) TaxID=3406628 RepID=UPI003C1D5D49
MASTGMDHAEAGRAVESAFDGRFTSWVIQVIPERALSDSVGEDLAVGLTGHAAPYRDHRERAAVEDLHDRH